MQGLEREGKTRLLLLLFLALGDALLEFFKVNDNAMLFRKFLDPHGDVQRHPKIHKEDSEKDPHDKGKFNIGNKPSDRLDDGRVDDIVEKYADEQPKQGEEGTDDALNVPPTVGIVPKFDLHPFDEDEPGDVFDDGHRDPHDEDDEQVVQPRHARMYGENGDAEEPRETESVEGETGSRQKAGVEPSLCGTEAAEQHFKTPTEDASHKKEEACNKKSVDK